MRKVGDLLIGNSAAHVSDETLSRLVSGELSSWELRRAQRHLYKCWDCRARHEKMERAAMAFMELHRRLIPPDPPKSAQWRERFLARLDEAAAKFAPDSARGWFTWFRPAMAVAAFVVLLLVIAYQNAVTIPQAKEEAAQGGGQLFTSSFSLRKANERGGEEVKVQVHTNESFALKFDFVPARTFDSYLCQLQDEAGRSLLQVSVPGTSANQEARLVVPAGRVKPGKYSLVFLGAPGSSGQGIKDEVLRLRFVVEFGE